MIIVSSILLGLLITSVYAIYNLMRKVEKYEDVVQDQVSYLNSISYIISESKKHLEKLDESGHFQADDELGQFFSQMKQIQEELNRYMLPENYGKEKN